MASTPQFVSVINLGSNLTAARISTANTGLTGAGSVATLLTGGSPSGTRVDRININATGNTTLGFIRFFLNDSSGSAFRLIKEIQVSAINQSSSVPAFQAEWVRTDGQPLVLVPLNWTLRASTHNAETFDVIPVVSGDY